MYPKLYFFLILYSFCFFSCKKEGNNSSQSVKLKKHELELHIGGKEQLYVLLQDASAEILNQLNWSSSNPEVATVTDKGEVNAIKVGVSVITVKYKASSDTCRVKVSNTDVVHPVDLSVLGQPLSQNMIYSKNVPLIAPFRVMQCFGLDNKGNIYYAQIGTASGFAQGKTKAHELYIARGTPNRPVGNDYMTLKYFGHGGQIDVENEGEDVYIWVSSNATKYSSGEYWDSRSVSRIKYESGKVYNNGYGGDTYFLNNGIYRIEAAVSKEKDLICINASKDGVRYFYTYKLSEVMALPLTDHTVTVKIGGEEYGTSEHTVTRTEKGHDLSALTPLGAFHLPKGNNEATEPNTLNFQGYDIDASGHIYFFEGTGNDNNVTTGSSHAYVTIFDIDGQMLKRAEVSAIEDIGSLTNEGLTNSSGYMEAEGIKVIGNHIYLGFASHQESEDYRRANILKYESKRD